MQDVADYLDTRRNVISQWETGQREPSYDHLILLADFYGVTTDWLLGREGAEKDSPRIKKVKSLLHDYLRLRESSLKGTAPGYRLQLAIQYLHEHDPEMFRSDRLAAQLLVNVEALQAFLDESLPCPQVVIQRFAHYANLPELWFYHPQPRLEDGLKVYREVLERLQADGIGPAELEVLFLRARRPSRRSK